MRVVPFGRSWWETNECFRANKLQAERFRAGVRLAWSGLGGMMELMGEGTGRAAEGASAAEVVY